MTYGISVIMPNWNAGSYIEQAISSVLAQTYEDFELIVVDGGSSDTSVSIIERIVNADSRIRLVQQKLNQGVSAGRNLGIRASQSNLLTFMDSDDLISKERLERLVGLSKMRGEAVLYSDPKEIDVRAEQIESGISNWTRPSGMILKYFFRQSLGDTASAGGIPNSGGSLTLPRSFFEKVGYFDEGLTYSEDLDLVLRLAAEFPFVYDAVVSYGHRWHAQNSYFRHGRRERYRQKARVISKNLFRNLESLDSSTKKVAFASLLSYYLASRQYSKVLRYSVFSKDSVRAVPILANRAIRTRLASLVTRVA